MMRLIAILLLITSPALAYTWHDVPVPGTTNSVTEMVEGEWRVVAYPRGDDRWLLVQDNSIRRGWFKTMDAAKAEAERHQKMIDSGTEPRHP